MNTAGIFGSLVGTTPGDMELSLLLLVVEADALVENPPFRPLVSCAIPNGPLLIGAGSDEDANRLPKGFFGGGRRLLKEEGTGG